jgi:hypothetical protein
MLANVGQQRHGVGPKSQRRFSLQYESTAIAILWG